MSARPQDALVLVVDDEPDVLNYLGALLEDAGFQVAKASGGEEALELVRQRRPDLVSLDLVMPEKSGTRFLFALRRDKDWARIPILIVTGHAHDDLGKGDLDDIMAGKVMSGPAVYLEKPVSPEGYVSAVKRQLGMETVIRSERDAEGMKSEVRRLLDRADPETTGNILKLLKGGTPLPSPTLRPEKALGRVLVIDDEPDVAAYLAAFLSDCGYDVDTATDPDEGVAKARASKPDLITLDVDMPRKNGVQVYEELREDANLDAVKVVVITAVPEKVRGLRGGKEMLDAVAGYLTKPFEPEALQETVAAALGR